MKVSLVLCLVVGIILLHLLSTTDAAKKEKDYKTHERYSVVFRKTAKRKDVKAVAKWLKDKDHKVTILKTRNIMVVKGKMSQRRLARLRKNKSIELVAEDALIQMACTNRQLFPNLAHKVDSLDGTTDWAIKADFGPNLTPTDIYVIDSGVRADHEEFERADGSSRVELLKDFINEASYQTHGTMTAGLAAGKYFGLDNKANIKDLRVLDSLGNSYVSDVMAAVDMARHRHKNKPVGTKSVIVMSMTIYVTGTNSFLISIMESIVADAATTPGLYVVAAAGNFASPAQNYSPCRVPSVICTGCVNNTHHFDDYYNYGPGIDLLAKGIDMLCASRSTTWSKSFYSGTSASTALLGGAISLYLSDYAPNAVPTRSQVVSFFEQHATTATFSSIRSNSGTTDKSIMLPGC